MYGLPDSNKGLWLAHIIFG